MLLFRARDFNKFGILSLAWGGEIRGFPRIVYLLNIISRNIYELHFL